VFRPSFTVEHDAPIDLHTGGRNAAGWLLMKKSRKQEAASAANVFQFSLAGLIIFSLALIGISSFRLSALPTQEGSLGFRERS